MDNLMSHYWGQTQWFTFRPFQPWHLQTILTTELTATATQTHFNPVLCLTATQKNTHRPIYTCGSTHICNAMKKNQNNKVQKLDAQGSRNHTNDWALLLKHQRFPFDSPIIHKRNKQDEGQNMDTQLVYADIGSVLVRLRNGWLICRQMRSSLW